MFQSLNHHHVHRNHHLNEYHIIYFDTFPVIEEAAAECERNIEMINYMNNLIDKVGLDYIQSIIDRNASRTGKK